MPSPSSALTSLRPELAGSLEEFDLEMDRQGFIGLRVLPVLDVAKAGGTFGKIPLEQLLQTRDTKRASGAGYSRGKWKFEEASFATQEHGAEEPIDDRDAALYSDYFDAEQVSTKRAYDAVLRNQEIRIAAAVFNTDTWTGSALTTTIGTNWTDPASTPFVSVEAAVQAVHTNSGMWPNAMVMDRTVFRNLRNNTSLIDRVKYQGFVDARAGNITAEAMAQAFDLKYLIVAGTSKNTANEGQVASLSTIWDTTKVMICRVAETNDIKEPCIGRTFHWGEDGSQIGGTVETYRDEPVRADIVRVRHEVAEMILYPQMGHLLIGL